MNLFRSETLPNGLVVEFFDDSNRYFGDYWRVRLEARCRVPVQAALAPESPDLPQALALLGEEALFVRPLEKMGVAGEEVEGVRTALAESFLASAASYLGSPAFPPRFVRQQLAERKKGRRPFLVPR